MLRYLFGEPRRTDKGLMLDANTALEKYLSSLASKPKKQPAMKIHRLALWSKGFIRALDELEQSVYCARKYGESVQEKYVENMSDDEKDQYHRHIYFYKNALVRLFSILDKLGYFMNEQFELKTEQVKTRFSYFTVLRTMRQRGLEPKLEQKLSDLKQENKPKLDRLRNQRNMEIHMMNADLLDDLINAIEARHAKDPRTHVEDIEQNIEDLHTVFDMACKAVACVFTYIVDSGGRTHR